VVAYHLKLSSAEPEEVMRLAMLDMADRMASFVSGATAVVLLLTPGQIVAANVLLALPGETDGDLASHAGVQVGDSRAVLCRGGLAIPLTLDHTPRLPEEVERVRALNGFIAGGRVNGIIAVTRTLGDNVFFFFFGSFPFSLCISCALLLTCLGRCIRTLARSPSSTEWT
jgi:serine/threonine protein phosphatase PrpC